MLSRPAHALAETGRPETAAVQTAHPEPPIGLSAAGLTNAAPTIGKGKRFHILSRDPRAVRARGTRARQKDGLMSISLDVHEHAVAKSLIASGRDEDQLLKPTVVKQALEQVIRDWIERWRPLWPKE
ncbi:hypothetical protein [Bradyrhizobium sp. CCBAU 45384]|uniref:hypothetical protein n=1 Tax=Bradyrhizobium sp. CCBAU 45384 TaxID=858428 RepID=UPI002305F4A0|nr:hypothetical protein [Bradyrhizobium sp. CCBAU 45384]MDA9405567.1 hypothetical protein [Bradyrhizobium sp. CCBAU 45384]